MKRLSTLHYKGQSYIVVDLEIENEFGYRYGTIDSNLVVNGKLVKKLNGLQMMLGKTVGEAVSLRTSNIDYKEMVDNGMSMEEIFKVMAERG